MDCLLREFWPLLYAWEFKLSDFISMLPALKGLTLDTQEEHYMPYINK